MYDGAGYPQMQGNIHPQQMEWLMQQQRMQGGPQPGAASRAYHLEPMNAQSPPPQLQQQRSSVQGMMMGLPSMGQMQQPGGGGGGMMGGMSAYGPMPMMGDMQDGRMSPGQGGGGGAAFGGAGAYGRLSMMGYGAAGMAGQGNPQSGAFGGAAGGGGGAEWGSVNFNGIFNNAGNPQTQFAVAAQDDGKPLPFPPGNLLAQYPPEYQQQLVFYYRLLRLQYPELYQQYVDYYEMYYEPLYYPAPPSPDPEEHRVHQPKKKKQPPPQPAPAPAPPPQPQPVQPQPVYHPPPVQQAPPVEQPKAPSNLPRSTSNLSGGLKRQSSLRRQNSMRRNEVNQLKNEGGLKRLPSMRQQTRAMSFYGQQGWGYDPHSSMHNSSFYGAMSGSRNAYGMGSGFHGVRSGSGSNNNSFYAAAPWSRPTSASSTPAERVAAAAAAVATYTTPTPFQPPQQPPQPPQQPPQPQHLFRQQQQQQQQQQHQQQRQQQQQQRVCSNPQSFYGYNALDAATPHGRSGTAPLPPPPPPPPPADDVPLLQRQNSSLRVLRRKVSFSGVPTATPEESKVQESQRRTWRPKRTGKRWSAPELFGGTQGQQDIDDEAEAVADEQEDSMELAASVATTDDAAVDPTRGQDSPALSNSGCLGSMYIAPLGLNNAPRRFSFPSATGRMANYEMPMVSPVFAGGVMAMGHDNSSGGGGGGGGGGFCPPPPFAPFPQLGFGMRMPNMPPHCQVLFVPTPVVARRF